MQIAPDIRSSVAPVPARPALVARNGDRLPVRPAAPVSALKRTVGQDDSRLRSEASRNNTPSESAATLSGPVAAPLASSLFLAQHIAQEGHGESRSSKAEDAASVAAYRGAAERGTVFFGLEYPVDFSV